MVETFSSFLKDCCQHSSFLVLWIISYLSQEMLVLSVVNLYFFLEKLSVNVLGHDSFEPNCPQHILEPLLDNVPSVRLDLGVSGPDFLSVRSHGRSVFLEHRRDHVALHVAHQIG